MTDSPHATTPEPHPVPLTRRWLLRIGGALGLAAAGATLSGATPSDATAANAVPADTPDAPGAFGRPPTEQVLRRQHARAKVAAQTTVRAPAGTAAGPEAISAPGARLTPSRAAIDSTPLTRRTGDTPWPAED